MDRDNGKKILPYKEATYDTYNNHRNLNSIIISDNEDNIAWFYNAFIQVYSIKDISYGAMSYNYNIDIAHQTQFYDRCPLVECFSIPNEILTLKYNNIADLCIDLINNNYYVFFTADRYYFTENPSLEPKIFFHDVMIYGYDIYNKQLLTIDFFKVKASTKWFSFETINSAYLSGKDSKSFVNGIVAVRNTDKFNWKFSIENYKENLKAYINGTPIVLYHYKFEQDMQYGYSDNTYQYYGINTYNTFYDILDNPDKLLAMNYNAFHLFMKHKLLILNSVKYIKKEKYFIDNKNIEQQLDKNYINSIKILNFIIKFKNERNKDKYILKKAKKSFDEIKENEFNVLTNLLNELCKHDDLYIVEKSNNNEWYFNKKNKIEKMIIKNDDYIKQVFIGDKIKIYANKHDEYGKARINIDGKHESIINLYNECLHKNELIYTDENLSYGNHIVNIYPDDTLPINISIIESESTRIQAIKNNIFEFIGSDNQTKGNWIGKYGNIGYDIFYERPNLPDNIVVLYKFYGDWDYHEIFDAEYNNQSAIMLPDKSKRIIPLMDSEFTMYVDVAVTSDNPIIMSLYFLNYTGTVKKQNIKVIDLNTKEEVHSLLIEDYYEGIYYSFKLKGLYRFSLDNGAKNTGKKTTSPINGLFFDYDKTN